MAYDLASCFLDLVKSAPLGDCPLDTDISECIGEIKSQYHMSTLVALSSHVECICYYQKSEAYSSYIMDVLRRDCYPAPPK